MPMELLTVIVPAYNAEKWIERCINSIINQTYKNIEILVINDGSTDRTEKIVSKIQCCHENITLINQENKGLAETRSVGISLAKDGFIGFVDADDTIEPDMYERLMQNAAEYDADISQCLKKSVISDQINADSTNDSGKTQRYVFDRNDGLRELLSGGVLSPSLCDKIYKREILLDSCLDSSISNSEDFLRNSVVFQRSRRSVCEDFYGYNYIRHDGSMLLNSSRQLEIEKEVFHGRSIIYENCTDPNLRPYAAGMLLHTAVISVVNLCGSKEENAKKYIKAMRKFICTHFKYYRYVHKKLRFRSALAAVAIMISPKTFSYLYHKYKKVTL